MDEGEVLTRATLSAARSSESAKTSPSGSISVTNADGTRTVLGAVNSSGSTMATHVGDTTPPGVPTGVTAWSGDGSLHVSWDGTLTGGIPADFDHVTLLVDGAAFATLAGAGSATCNGMTIGATVSVTVTSEDDVCADDGTARHNVSAPCTAIPVIVTDVADGLSRLIRETDDGVDVGKSADGTTYADGTSVTRQGTDGSFSILKMLSGVLTSVASFAEDLIELGRNSASSIIRMCGGKVAVSAVPDGKGRYTGILSGDYGAMIRSANGTASVGVDGFQDLISMVSGNLQVDDGTDALTQVSMRRFLTAVEPVVLFSGPATTGTVTLTETAAGFKWVTVFYHYGAVFSSVMLSDPDSKTAALYLMLLSGAGLWIKTRSLLISGTALTNSGQAANYCVDMSSGACVYHGLYDTPEIIIDRVEGRR